MWSIIQGETKTCIPLRVDSIILYNSLGFFLTNTDNTVRIWLASNVHADQVTTCYNYMQEIKQINLM